MTKSGREEEPIEGHDQQKGDRPDGWEGEVVALGLVPCLKQVGDLLVSLLQGQVMRLEALCISLPQNAGVAAQQELRDLNLLLRGRPRARAAPVQGIPVLRILLHRARGVLLELGPHPVGVTPVRRHHQRGALEDVEFVVVAQVLGDLAVPSQTVVLTELLVVPAGALGPVAPGME